MYQSSKLSITSKKALISTFKVDKQVYRWFMYLVLQENLRKELCQKEEIQKEYTKADNFLKLEKLIYAALVMSCFFIIFFGFKYIGILLIVVGVKEFLYFNNKKNIYKICQELIDRDFDQLEFEFKTLFQVGEHYGRKYNIASLLQIMTTVNGYVRMVIFYSFVFVTFIWPLNFLYSCTSILSVYYIFYSIVNVNYVYKKLK